MLAALTLIIDRIVSDRTAQAGGFLLGLFAYLVQPTAAFYALWIAVAMDLVSRLIAESAKAGGYLKATRERRIRSDKMLQGTAVKCVAYFFLTVLAYQSKHLVSYEQIPLLLSTIIYSILFLVELHSMVENFVEAGVDELKPLLLRIQREQKRFEDGEEPPVASNAGGGDDDV